MKGKNKNSLFILMAFTALLLFTIGLSLFISDTLWHRIHLINTGSIIIYNDLLKSYNKLVIKCINGHVRLSLDNGTTAYNKSFIIVDLKTIHISTNDKRGFILISCSQPAINRTTNNVFQYNNKIEIILENTQSQQDIVSLILLILGLVMIILLTIYTRKIRDYNP